MKSLEWLYLIGLAIILPIAGLAFLAWFLTVLHIVVTM